MTSNVKLATPLVHTGDTEREALAERLENWHGDIDEDPAYLLEQAATMLRALAATDVVEAYHSARLVNGTTISSAGDAVEAIWRDGYPRHPWADEWFIAVTTYGDRIVLRSLPEEYAYDFKTADETYIKRDRIKKWMPFPDSQFAAPPAPELKAEAGVMDALKDHAEAFTGEKYQTWIQPGPEVKAVADAWQELCERDDRNSPAEYPEMCLITHDELADFMSRAAPPAPSQEMSAAEMREAAARRIEGFAAMGQGTLSDHHRNLATLIRALPLTKDRQS